MSAEDVKKFLESSASTRTAFVTPADVRGLQSPGTMRRTADSLRIVSAQISENQYEKLKRISGLTKATISSIIRQAIDKHVSGLGALQSHPKNFKRCGAKWSE